MRWPTPLTPIIISKLIGGSGGSVTPDSIVTATGQMTEQQAADTLGNIGGEAAPSIVTDLSSTSITLANANNNTEYNYGELSALTISSIPATGYFEITFTSGSTATVLTVPNTMIMPDSFAVEANTRYEINCKDGYALVAGWAVSA